MSGYVRTPDAGQALLIAMQTEAVIRAQSGLLPIGAPMPNTALSALQVAAHRQTEAQIA